MKVRRRDLAVFSISALDLFASGMGAFVLLTLMAMPFFPNTSSGRQESQLEASQARVADLERMVSDLQQAVAGAASADEYQRVQQQLQSARNKLAEVQQGSSSPQEALSETQEQLAAAQSRIQQLEEGLKSVRLPHLDMVICLDVTGSMRDQIEGLKAEITSLTTILDRLAPSVGIGIVAFGDRRWQQTIHQLRLTRITNLSALERFVNGLTVNMNDPFFAQNTDGPEAVDQALQRALTTQWRSESEKRYIIVITDNPAYPESQAKTIEDARRFSSASNHHVSAVRANMVSTISGDPRFAKQYLQRLASAGNGNFVDAAGGESMLSTLLLAILE